MATHAAATRNLSGLARALAQNGLMTEYDAETLQTQAQQASISFVEQLLLGKRMSAHSARRVRDRGRSACRCSTSRAFDLDQIHKELVDLKMAQTRRVLPLHKRGNRLYVAISDPANLQALEEVRFKTNLVVEPVVVEDDKLAQAIQKLVEATGATLKDVGSMEDLEIDLLDGGPIALTDEENSEVEDAPVVKYIQKILIDAINLGVSDIHFEPYEKYYRIRYRLDGILSEVAQPPLVIKDKIASRIKVISQARHLREARAAGRPDEARAVEDRRRSTFACQHAADAVRRKDRDADPRFRRREARHRGAGLRARPAGTAACSRSGGRTG